MAGGHWGQGECDRGKLSKDGHVSMQTEVSVSAPARRWTRAMLPLPRLSQSSQALTAGRQGKEENPNNWISSTFPTPVLSGETEPDSHPYLNAGNEGQSSGSLM